LVAKLGILFTQLEKLLAEVPGVSMMVVVEIVAV
jgi:hypothetical protein